MNNSRVSLLKFHFVFRLRDVVPTFHACFSKQTQARSQVRLFTASARWKLPRASLWKSWRLNMWLWRSGQKPAVFERAKCQTQCWQRATLARCVVVNCHEGVFQITNRIQCDSDVNPWGRSSLPFCSFVQPCVAHMSVNSVLARGEIMVKTLKDFWWLRLNAGGVLILPPLNTAWKLCWKLEAGLKLFRLVFKRKMKKVNFESLTKV